MRIFLSSVVLLVMWVTPAAAQPSDRFPVSSLVTQGDEIYRAFDLGNFKELLKIDADLVAAEATIVLQEKKIVALGAMIPLYQEALRLEQSSARQWADYSSQLFKKWEAENKARHEAENKPKASNIAGWTTATGFGLLSLVLVTHLVF